MFAKLLEQPRGIALELDMQEYSMNATRTAFYNWGKNNELRVKTRVAMLELKMWLWIEDD
jgi:hypothetical protein